MSYFQNVPRVPYRFGTSAEYTLHQNLTSYVDLIDQVRDNNSFYQKYHILDGDRPDNLSYKIYGTPKYYWTFFLMNDHLRENGWPITHQEVLELVKKERNNTVLTTRNDITGKFKVGSTVTGASSGASGEVIRRRLDLGQIVIKGKKSFLSTEEIQDDVSNTATLVAAADEHNAIYCYKNSDDEIVDINPYAAPGSELVPTTYYERYVEENNALKDIIVIKPDSIAAIFEQFQDQMRL
jgi:hypothetical protein